MFVLNVAANSLALIILTDIRTTEMDVQVDTQASTLRVWEKMVLTMLVCRQSAGAPPREAAARRLLHTSTSTMISPRTLTTNHCCPTGVISEAAEVLEARCFDPVILAQARAIPVLQ